MTDITFANTSVDCLKYTWDWGGTAYLNVCTGATNFVPWGTMDYVQYSVLAAFFFAVCFILIVIAIGIAALVAAIVYDKIESQTNRRNWDKRHN